MPNEGDELVLRKDLSPPPSERNGFENFGLSESPSLFLNDFLKSLGFPNEDEPPVLRNGFSSPPSERNGFENLGLSELNESPSLFLKGLLKSPSDFLKPPDFPNEDDELPVLRNGLSSPPSDRNGFENLFDSSDRVPKEPPSL